MEKTLHILLIEDDMNTCNRISNYIATKDNMPASPIILMLAFNMYRIRFLTLLFLIWNCITAVETDCFSSLT